MASPHIPVLLDEVVSGLALAPDDMLLDGTIGFGGHSGKLLESLSPKGLIIGLDQDTQALAYCKARFSDITNVSLHHANFSQFPDVLQQLKIPRINKVLLDLGVSSLQLDEAQRGFSFQKEGPLDMRMNAHNNPLTAAELLQTYSSTQLETMFKTYGEIKNPTKLVQNILTTRTLSPFSTTLDLVSIIKKSFFFRNQRTLFIKTCAQVFQAIRMEVNQELENLSLFLNNVESHLAPNGRVAIITFHSLEDRMVKFFFKERPHFKPVNKKVIHPTYRQTQENPRSRSAKLRVLEFLP